MATKIAPTVQIKFFDSSAIPIRDRTPLIVADRFGSTIFPGSDSRGITSADFSALDGLSPTINDQWYKTPSYVAPGPSRTLQFVRLLHDGTVAYGATAQPLSQVGGEVSLSGWIFAAREAVLDSKIGDNGDALDGGNTAIHWEAPTGKWKTVLSQSSPLCTRIFNIGSDVNARARTVGTLPRCREMRFELRFLGLKAQGPLPGARVGWGNDKYSIEMRHNCQPVVAVMVEGNWVILKTLNDVKPCNLAGGAYVIRVMRIAGRLVIEWNGASFHIQETRTGTDPKKEAQRIDSVWPEGKVSLNCYNVRTELSIATIKYADPNGTLFTGSLARRQVRRSPLAPVPDSGLLGYPIGWLGDGSSGVVTIDEATDGASGGIQYTLSMRPSQDGLSSPFVSQVQIYLGGRFTTPVEHSIDVVAAAETLDLTLASPAAGNSMTQGMLKLDRLRLRDITPNWQNFVQSFHVVSVTVTDNFSDGTTGDPVCMFKGYGLLVGMATPGLFQWDGDVALVDSMYRLKAPAAITDHRVPPGDIWWAQKVAQAQSPDQALFYAWDGAREVLRIHLGEDEANRMEVVMPAESFPLLGADSDKTGLMYLMKEWGISGNGQPPAQDGWMLPAPYGQDGAAHIAIFQKYDNAYFFVGWPAGADRSTTFPVFIYGRPEELLKNRTVYEVKDADYFVIGDLNRMATSVQLTLKPEKMFNRILAWSSPPGQNIDIVPAVRMAEAPFLYGPGLASLSWERTFVMRSEIGWLGSGVEYLAYNLRNQLQNVDMRWPRVTAPGIASIGSFDKVKITMAKGAASVGSLDSDRGDASDPDMNLDGKIFRVESIQHTFDFRKVGWSSFTTSMSLRPILNNGL